MFFELKSKIGRRDFPNGTNRHAHNISSARKINFNHRIS